MNITRTRFVPFFCLAAAVVSLAVFTAPVSGENLSFVFLADSRADKTTVTQPLLTPVNTPVVNAMVSQIGSDIRNNVYQPSFAMFAGDMSYRGYIKYESMDGFTFQAWKKLFDPLTSKDTFGLPLYTTMGNHELYSHGDGKDISAGLNYANQVQFQKDFSENPSNGPTGYEHLTYSFTSPGGDAFFAVLDPYYITKNEDPYPMSGTIDPTQLAWLEAQVALTTATHKFLFIHTPYYYVTGSDPNDPSEAVGAPDETYTALWNLLDSNKFDAYFCGHQHIFSRKTIDSSVPPQNQPPNSWQSDVVQLLNGAAGANIDTSQPTRDASWNIHQAPNTYHYTVVNIDGPKVTFTTYSGSTGSYTVCDTFTKNDLITATPEPSTFALLGLGLGGLAFWKRRQRRA